MRQIVLFVSFMLLSLVWFTNAAEPNFVRSKVINVDGASNDVVSTEYSDGLGRAIQNKQKLANGRASVVSTFYDNASRPYLTTKPFVDLAANSTDLFTPGDFTEINEILNNNENYDGFKVSGSAYAYSETEYYDDPLGRVKRAGAPGNAYKLTSEHFTSSWTFGVVKNLASPIKLTVEGNDRYIKITDGFITAFSDLAATLPVSLTYKILDKLYDELLQNPIANADHFLSVSRDPDEKISQELKDLFGKTVATRTGAYASPIIAGYEFDILGNVLLEHAPKEGSTTLISDSKYEYNTLGQLVRKETPDGAIERMTYNNDGSLKTKCMYVLNGSVEVCKKTLAYEYDEMGRLIAIKMPYQGGPIYYVKYYHDNCDNLLGEVEEFGIPFDAYSNLENTQGRLVAEVAFNRPDGLRFYTGKTSYVIDLYSYNDEGLVKTKFKVIPGLPLQKISYEYDNHGKMLNEEFRCGATVSKKFYTYNEYGTLKDIAHGNNTNIVTSYKYDLLGKFDTTYFSQISNGNMLRRTYNVRGWMDTSSFNGVNNFKQVVDYNDTINPNPTFNGNIRASEITYTQGATVVPFIQNYNYDIVNRLTSVETRPAKNAAVIPEFAASYQYDQTGRFISKVEGTNSSNSNYDYYSDGTRVTSRLKNAKTNGGLYLYDFKGNMVIDSAKNMVVYYDWRNMPTRFSFYSSLPVGQESDKKIQPDDCGTITINDNAYAGKDPTTYVDWLCEKGDVTLLSSVQMLYDAAGKRVLKIAK